MSLIAKYNISKEDIQTILSLESEKKEVGFIEKQKIQVKITTVLKKYNVKFLDLGNLNKELIAFDISNYEEVIGSTDKKDASSREDSKKTEVDPKDASKGDPKKGCVPLIIIIGLIFILVKFCGGPSKGSVDQALTNKYSGEYVGKIPTGYIAVDYTIYVDPIKYVKKNEYKAYISGHGQSTMGSVVSLAGGKMTITISEEINEKTGKVYAPKICLYSKEAGNILGGDPCDPYFSSKPKAVIEGDTVVYEDGGIIHDGWLLHKVANKFYREDLNNSDKDKWE